MRRMLVLPLFLGACGARPIVEDLDADDPTADDDPIDAETTAGNTMPPLDTGRVRSP